MLTANMISIQSHNEHPVVFVAKPSGNRGRTDPRLQTLGRKKVTTGVKCEPTDIGNSAGSNQRLLRAKEFRAISFVRVWEKQIGRLAPGFKPSTKPRKKIYLPGLIALLSHDHVPSLEIDILPPHGLGSLTPDSAQAQELNEVRSLTAVFFGRTPVASQESQNGFNFFWLGHMDAFMAHRIYRKIGSQLKPHPAPITSKSEKPPQVGGIDLSGASRVFHEPYIKVLPHVMRSNLVHPKLTKLLRGHFQMPLNALKRFPGQLFRLHQLSLLLNEIDNRLSKSGDVLCAIHLDGRRTDFEQEIVQSCVCDFPNLGFETVTNGLVVFLDNCVITTSLRPNEKMFSNPGILCHTPNHSVSANKAQVKSALPGGQIGVTQRIILTQETDLFSLLKWAISSAVRAPAWHAAPLLGETPDAVTAKPR
jgi:hypothetical protein